MFAFLLPQRSICYDMTILRMVSAPCNRYETHGYLLGRPCIQIDGSDCPTRHASAGLARSRDERAYLSICVRQARDVYRCSECTGRLQGWSRPSGGLRSQPETRAQDKGCNDKQEVSSCCQLYTSAQLDRRAAWGTHRCACNRRRACSPAV